MANDDAVPPVAGAKGPVAKSGRAKPFSVHDYVVSILVALGLTVLYGGYYWFQRTYFFNAPQGIDAFYVPDKVIAVVAIVLFAFCFLIGPLYRYFNAFDYLMQYRKEIGIVGGYLAIIHPFVAYFFLPLTFPQSAIPFISLTYGTALIGSLVALFLIFISFQSAIIMLGANRWWFLHRWGLRVLVLASVIHFFGIEWTTWVDWLTKAPPKPTPDLLYPWIPEPTTFAGLFAVWVVIVRLYETVFLYKDLGWKPKDIAPNAQLRARGRRFCVYSFWVLVAAHIYVIGRSLYYFSVG